MKKSKWIKPAFAAIVLVAISVASCKKSSSPSSPSNPSGTEETASASDNANAEHTVSDITEIVAEASDGSAQLSNYRSGVANQFSLLSSCATVTRDTANKTLTITFSGSPCIDGRTRSGSIMVNYFASTQNAKHYRDPGFSCSVTSNNYTVDGNQVSIINKTITNNTALGFNPSTTSLTWTVNAHIRIVKANSGGTFDYSCTRVKTLINTADVAVYHGAGSPISWLNARVGITGTATGTTTAGVTYSAIITSMLIRDYGACSINGRHPFIMGTIQYTPSGHVVRTIDYGNGTCDNTATVTVNGVTTTITLN